jgi:hypothetical protein
MNSAQTQTLAIDTYCLMKDIADLFETFSEVELQALVDVKYTPADIVGHFAKKADKIHTLRARQVVDEPAFASGALSQIAAHKQKQSAKLRARL